MTAPNPAVDAVPGDRFTTPDGGTWVMLARGLLAADGPYWSYVSPTGHWSQRKQEEAEAANLVPLVGYETYIEDSLKASDAPAPLDPGNPEHLRQVADAVVDFPLPQWEDATEEKLEQDAETAQEFARFWRAEADRIEREAAEQAREAEQDAADRKRAEMFIREHFPDHLNSGGPALIEAFIRAERQEAGQ